MKRLSLLCFYIFLFITVSLDASKVIVKAIGITVSDMERSISFYHDLLDFEILEDKEVTGENYQHLFGIFGLRVRLVTMKLKNENIVLKQFLTPTGRPIPIDSRSNDLWFQHIAITVSDMKAAFERLQKHHVLQISPSPQILPEWNPNVHGIQAIYFKDPDGHPLELLKFPPGKGHPKWQKNKQNLFLGIDHTAIGVKNTQESLKLYRDLLGFKVVGESVNYGIEQQYLTNVFGAKVRITSLLGEGGPGVEFLEYLSPSDGREMPSTSRSNDLWAWHIHVAVDDIEKKSSDLMDKKYRMVSNQLQKFPNQELQMENGMLFQDPDGHSLLLSD